MSWDIYGNPLRRGHCEVHPHVHEEYPCSVCMAERKRNQQQPDYELERLNYELDQQNEYIKELTLSNKNLTAALQKVSDYNLRLENDRDKYIKLKFYVEKLLLEGDWYISAIEGSPRIDFEEVRKDITDIIGWEKEGGGE